MAKKSIILYSQLRKAAFIFGGLTTMVSALTACIDKFDAELPASDTQLLVVEGSIISNQTCRFTLSRTFNLKEPILNVPTHQVSDAQLCIKGSDGTRIPCHYVSSGAYEAVVGPLSKDQTFWLEIDADGEHYASDALVPLVTPAIESLTYAQTRADQEVDILVTPAIEGQENSQTNYYCWTRDIWWEVRTPYHSFWEYRPDSDDVVSANPDVWRGFRHELHYDKVIASNADYQEGRIRDLRLYSEDHNDDRFVCLYYTKVTQMAISAQEYEYEKLNTQQQEGMGGLFTPQPSELPSNVHCISDPDKSAIGFIGVSANVSTADIFISRDDVSYSKQYDYTIYPSLAALKKKTNLEAYNSNYRVMDYDAMSGSISWVKSAAVDCREAPWFASLEAPDFWPDTTH